MVDDKYIITGSMGMELTGFYNDIEIAIGIHDPDGDFVGNLRRTLWSEHLMTDVSDPTIQDPLGSVI